MSGLFEWQSPNGVTHLVPSNGLPCLTCGRRHDPVDEMAEEIAQGIISEADGDLDLAIKIAERTKYLLSKLNDPQFQEPTWIEGISRRYRIDQEVLQARVNLRNVEFSFNGLFVGFGDAAGEEPPKFGATDYSEDQL